MISQCANPDCLASFDHRGGRFFCFHRHHAPDEAPPNAHSVQHFWLCRQCSEVYVLEDRSGEVKLICSRLRHSPRGCQFRQIATA